MSVHVFGIRHHGPGCARSLRSALEELQPDVVLVEAPADAHHVIPLLIHKQMQPPVALLIYRPDEPLYASYYPLAIFSPEWQALHYALERGVAVRLMDLPQALLFGDRQRGEDGPGANDDGTRMGPAQETRKSETPDEPSIEDDPLRLLSLAAGYDDEELWWEQQIEQRRDARGVFEGINTAMLALRAEKVPRSRREAQREAYMRQTLRQARTAGFQRIAVVCGAWHVPALLQLEAFDEREDLALFSQLKRVKVEVTWIPWTNERLSYRSGYGAGIRSPGWYELLWTAPDRALIRWIAQAAQLLRAEGRDVSSASVIEAVRLAETLAALRDLSAPGLAEAQEAIQTLLCQGERGPLELIRRRLEIGERLGQVPDETPTVPLQRNVEELQRRLRLKPTTAPQQLELDLRDETDRARSQMLYRLRLLGIAWGEPLEVPANKRGTFHEYWQLTWRVDFTLALIGANIWGNTLESAATHFALYQSEHVSELPALSELLERVRLAALPAAFPHVLRRLRSCAALTADVEQMMRAILPLVQIARYGDVRQSDTAQVQEVINALFERVLIGLPSTCRFLDDAAAATLQQSLQQLDASLYTLSEMQMLQAWQALLQRLIHDEMVHPLVRGRCCRLLLDRLLLPETELSRLARLTLSLTTPATQAAAWIEGLLTGNASRLLLLDSLWLALDHWLQSLDPEQFISLLPLLRRACRSFSAPERQAIGEKVQWLYTPRPALATGGRRLDEERARLVLPVLSQILGVPAHVTH